MGLGAGIVVIGCCLCHLCILLKPCIALKLYCIYHPGGARKGCSAVEYFRELFKVQRVASIATMSTTHGGMTETCFFQHKG